MPVMRESCPTCKEYRRSGDVHGTTCCTVMKNGRVQKYYHQSQQWSEMPRLELAVEAEPAHFEAFRQYLDDAVTQLKQDMTDQAVAYAVPSDDVLALIKAVAKRQDVSPWQVWQAWALRHQIPVEDFVRSLCAFEDGFIPPTTRGPLRKRLRDLLGYIVLALIMTEEA